MPEIRKPVAEVGLPPWLTFKPWPQGDPGPEVYALVHDELDTSQRLEFVQALIGIELAMTEARVEGLRELQKIVAPRARPSRRA